jgi:hypothetical protein
MESQQPKQQTLKKLAISLIIAVLLITLDNLYFEYFISRELATFITYPIGILIILANVWVLIRLIKNTRTILKF